MSSVEREMLIQAIEREPQLLAHAPDEYKAQRHVKGLLKESSGHYKEDPYNLACIPDCFATHELCNEAVKER